jgi:hypothetical protein
MVTEVAIFQAVPGKEDELGQAILQGLEVIRQHPECISARVERCIEQPGQYMNGLFQESPVVYHYQPF